MNRNKWMWLAVGAVVLLAAGLCICVIAGAGYFYLSNRTTSSDVIPPEGATRAAKTREVQQALTEAVPTSTPRPDLVTFSDPDGFYQVSYPPDWETKKSGSEQQFCRGDGKVCMAVSLQVKVVSGGQVAELTRAFLKDKLAGYIVSAREESKLDGRAAVWMEHSYNENDAPVAGFLVGTVYNRVGYLILVWAPAEEYPGLKAELQATARTFHALTSPDAPPYNQWKTRATDNLTFHYLPGTWVEEEIDSIAAQHQSALKAMQKALKLPEKIQSYPYVTYQGAINIYLYPSVEALYRSTARQSGFAISEMGEVHALWISAGDHQTPGHELTHVITYAAWKDPTQALLGEGLAACLDQSGRDYRAVGGDLVDSGTYIPLADTLGDRWFEQDASISYPESGSVACYLLGKYGAEKVKALYQARDFEAVLEDVLGVDLAGLEEGWIEWVGGKE